MVLIQIHFPLGALPPLPFFVGAQQWSSQNFCKNPLIISVPHAASAQAQARFARTQARANHCSDIFYINVFGCKEVGGSKEMGKYNCSLHYLSKHRKRKIRKLLFLFSSLFYTTISSLPECYS